VGLVENPRTLGAVLWCEPEYSAHAETDISVREYTAPGWNRQTCSVENPTVILSQSNSKHLPQ